MPDGGFAEQLVHVDLGPGRVRDGPAATGSAAGPRPAVVLLSRACDTDLDAVARLLTAAAVPVLRIDADDPGAVGPLIDVDAATVRTAAGLVRPTVCWTRHFSGRAVRGTGDHGLDLFLHDSWQAVAAAVAALAVTDLAPAPGGLLAPLRTAARHGIRVPRTVVTTDPVLAGLRGPRVVVKALAGHFTEVAPGRLTGRFPVVVEQSQLVPAMSGAPVVVQEHVEHDVELRVYHLGGRIRAFAIDKGSAADPWVAPHRVRVRPVVPPADVTAATRTLAGALSLHYGAFDFLLGPDGPVFLEVNVDGDWGWVERGACVDLAFDVARMLAELHWAALPAARPPQLDLPAFLSATHAGGRSASRTP